MRSVDTSTMTDAASAPQPSSQFVIAAFQEEVEKVNANRMYLLACLRECQHEAQAEISRLQGVIASILSMVDDEDRDRIKAMLEEGSHGAVGD